MTVLDSVNLDEMCKSAAHSSIRGRISVVLMWVSDQPLWGLGGSWRAWYIANYGIVSRIKMGEDCMKITDWKVDSSFKKWESCHAVLIWIVRPVDWLFCIHQVLLYMNCFDFFALSPSIILCLLLYFLIVIGSFCFAGRRSQVDWREYSFINCWYVSFRNLLLYETHFQCSP